MIKRLLILLLLSCVLFNNVNAQEKKEYDYEEFSKIGQVVESEMISINGKLNQLFRVFENRESALKNYSEQHSTFIELIQKTGSLDPLSSQNYPDYRSTLLLMLSDNVHLNNSLKSEIKLFNMFFDIFENDDVNTDIKNIINDDKDVQEKEQLLLALLPSDSPFVIDHQNNPSKAILSYNRTNAVNYAKAHAESGTANTTDYAYYVDGDCANFCSQILEAGGVAQNDTGSIYSGWWHKLIASTVNYSSRSWTYAPSFCSYHGMYYYTTSHSSFSSNITVGSIVSIDFTNDGSWDHVGCISQMGSYSSSLGYIDYKVAQHTSDYNAWASGSVNGWDLYSGSGKYGVVIH